MSEREGPIKYSVAQLDEVAARNADRSSFHVFAEGMHSDVRGEIRNLRATSEFSLPHELWPHHVFIVIVLAGKIVAHVSNDTVEMRTLSQLVVLPGVPCRLSASSAASVQIISLLSMPPVEPGAG